MCKTRIMFYHADNMSISRLVQLDIGEFDIGEKTEEHCESPLTCALKTIMLLSNNSLALVRILSHSTHAFNCGGLLSMVLSCMPAE